MHQRPKRDVPNVLIMLHLISLHFVGVRRDLSMNSSENRSLQNGIPAILDMENHCIANI